MAEKIRIHLFVSGRVQGVLFRQHARARALELGLKGWARNLLDDRVEIIAEGEKENIEKFIEWCKKGPPMAKVEHVAVSFEGYKGEFKDFSVREFGF
ncbi:MAG: acylphosphatase [Candidatus Wildermuthbacteria bacterium]|nr:acylphosphatase [Candidatus Wildermuthbacteria bacterium]